MISGHVYVLECDEFVKIGYSANPSKRISNLRNQLNSKNGRSFISERCEFATDYERACHREFSELCIGNERFATSFDMAVGVVEKMNPKNLTREEYAGFVYSSGGAEFNIEKIRCDTMCIVEKYAKDTPLYDMALNCSDSVVEMISIQNEARKYRLMLLETLDQIEALKLKIGV